MPWPVRPLGPGPPSAEKYGVYQFDPSQDQMSLQYEPPNVGEHEPSPMPAPLPPKRRSRRRLVSATMRASRRSDGELAGESRCQRDPCQAHVSRRMEVLLDAMSPPKSTAR